jgi:hypothetical protein
MGVKTLAVTLGVGAAAGAVAIMMLPRTSPMRKLAYKAASSMEDAAYRVGDKLSDAMDM